MRFFTIEEIARDVKGTLDGSSAIRINGLEQITEASENQLTFIGDKKYARLWAKSSASAALVSDTIDVDPGPGRALVRVANADLALAKILKLFAPEPPQCDSGIHPSAVVDPGARIGKGVAVGAGCYIGPGVTVGNDTRIYPNVTVMDHTHVGSQTVIWSGTVIRERCRIGSRCIIHPNVTIGADGFGYRPSPEGDGIVGIPHIGTVEIEDDVEIGAGTCIDRGKFSATVIGKGTKLDNLIQIGHNCKIGRFCLLAGHTALAGSVTVGDQVLMGGACILKDHVTIGDRATLGGGTGIMRDVPPGQTVLGIPADSYRQTLRLWAAQKKLPDLISRMEKAANADKQDR